MHKSFLSFPFSCLFGHDKTEKLRWIWELRNKVGERWSYKDIKGGGDEEEELHCSIPSVRLRIIYLSEIKIFLLKGL